MPSKNLPFDLSDDSATIWLQSLSQTNSVNAANQLNKVIKLLKPTSTDGSAILKILIQLTPTTLYICADIHTHLETDENNEKSKKIEKLCILLLRNLSLSFYLFSNTKKVSAEESNLAIYFSLQLIAYSQRSSIVFNQFPSATLWKVTEELYATANKRAILQQEIKHKIKDFKQLTTIENTLKRNLIYSIIASYQYNSTENSKLFSISSEYAHLIMLSHAENNESTFIWNCSNQSAPIRSQNITTTNTSLLSINTDALILKFQSTTASLNFKKETLENTINKLTGYKKIINSPLPSTFTVNHLLTGIVDVTLFLKKTENLNKIHQLSAEFNDYKNTESQKMSLEPMEFEKSHVDNSQPPSNTQLLTDTSTVKILKHQQQRFIIAETKPIDCVIDDVALLCSSQPYPELGIIKQIKTLNSTDTQHILIEKITGTPSLKMIESANMPTQQAIHISAEKPSILISPCKLSSKTEITSSTENNWYLDSLIEKTPFYMHYSIKK